jgi:hypothetical protein
MRYGRAAAWCAAIAGELFEIADVLCDGLALDDR